MSPFFRGVRAEGAVGLGLEIEVDLVGLDLRDRLALLHGVARLFVPRTTFPSVIASPILGMIISAIGVHHFLHGADDLRLVRRGQQLEIARVRHRHVLAGHARDRRIELVEHRSR